MTQVEEQREATWRVSAEDRLARALDLGRMALGAHAARSSACARALSE